MTRELPTTVAISNVKIMMSFISCERTTDSTFDARFRLTRRAFDDPQLANSVLIKRKRRVLDHRVYPALLFIVIVTMKEDNLFTQKQFLLKSCFGAVIKRKCLTLAELTLERFDDFTDKAPVIVTRNAADDLR